MAIRLGCKCGQQIITEESSMGQIIRCPYCNILLKVPDLQQAIQTPVPQTAPPAPAQVPPYPQQPDPSFQQGLPPPTGCQENQLPPSQHLQAGYPAPSPPAVNDDEQPILEEEEFEEEEDEEEKEQNKKERRRAKRRLLKVVSLGLTLIFWSLICLLAGLGFMTGLWLINFIALQIHQFNALTGEGGGPTLEGAGPILLVLLFGYFTLMFAHGILYVIGSVLCCWVPPKSGAKMFILLSVGFMGAAFGMMLLMFIIILVSAFTGPGAFAAFGSSLALVFFIMSAGLILAGFILFILFLRALAYYLNQRSTGDEAVAILFTWILLFVLVFPTVFVAFGVTLLVPFAGSWMGAAMLATWFGFWVKQWIRLLNVVATVRQVLGYEFGV